MTASNHAVTSALIAVLVPKPAIAIPLSFAAHFIMDAIPHFGLSIGPTLVRNQNRLFRKILLFDIVLAGSLLIMFPFVLSPSYNPFVVFACMFACMSPDLVWGWRFLHELKTKTEKPKNFFSKFHLWVQWNEKPAGWIYELIWFATTSLLIIINA